jgi:glycosyltransferase involved in cell wall biosynthesis
MRRRFEARIDAASCRRFDSVVAVSDSVRRFLLRRYGLSPDRVVTIRNGWSGKPLPRKTTRPLKTKILICIANFREEKGHSVLLEAFARLQSVPFASRLVLLGDGPLRVRLEEQVKRLSLSGKVDLAGVVADIWPHLAAADILVLPSLSEPLGMVVLEAMAAGLPVVATDVGGVPELVEDGVTGRLVPVEDPVEMANVLAKLLSDQDRLLRMGASARVAAKSFKMDVMVDRYFELYDELVATEARS